MTHVADKVIARSTYEALVFDLDGVVTSTADLHGEAWKRLFDEFLEACPDAPGRDRSAFALPGDYLEHVDGKPRADGVRDFLVSRGIELPDGDPRDPSTAWTVHGLGTRKDGYYHELLQRRGAKVYQSTVVLIRRARQLDFKVAVASSSRNCEEVLAATGLSELFDARFDGNDLAARGLPGKPDPAMFVEAARLLDVPPRRAVVFEDAVSGVEAGRRAGFALVVGVNRGGQAEQLIEHGAHIVVEDLAELEVTAGDA